MTCLVAKGPLNHKIIGMVSLSTFACLANPPNPKAKFAG